MGNSADRYPEAPIPCIPAILRNTLLSDGKKHSQDLAPDIALGVPTALRDITAPLSTGLETEVQMVTACFPSHELGD